FSLDEREAAGATAALGISFITEGAIPYAAKDPLRVIPALMNPPPHLPTGGADSVRGFFPPELKSGW
ncbi:MAG TPA: hypothetical protein PLJ20_07265, partial [Candidatus Contendobacter sp.]|nr:hypothetical protein [Candidatus Contendobacter sp.]